MDIDSRVISKQEYEEFKRGVGSEHIQNIWQNILLGLSESIKKEALSKGFKLKEGEKSMGLLNLYVKVPNASAELENCLNSSNSIIICQID